MWIYFSMFRSNSRSIKNFSLKIVFDNLNFDLICISYSAISLGFRTLVDRHRFDADPDPNIHDPCWSGFESASPWCRSSCGSYLKFNTCRKIQFIFFIFSQSLASLQCFIFLTSVKDVIILIILNSILKFCGKKYTLVNKLFHTDNDPDRLDPDRHALDDVHDPDRAKWCGSGKMLRIRPHLDPQHCYWITN